MHAFVHVRFRVMMWSNDALDPLRRSLRVYASDSISVPCVECTKSYLRKGTTVKVRRMFPMYECYIAAGSHVDVGNDENDRTLAEEYARNKAQITVVTFLSCSRSSAAPFCIVCAMYDSAADRYSGPRFKEITFPIKLVCGFHFLHDCIVLYTATAPKPKLNSTFSDYQRFQAGSLHPILL